MIKNILLLLLIIVEWLMMGIGYTTKLGSPINSILFYGGFLAIIYVVIYFISYLNSKFIPKS